MGIAADQGAGATRGRGAGWRAFAALFAAALAVAGAAPARAVDWSQVPGREVVLFYPARMSWEALLSPEDHSGADKFRSGRDCRACHGGEEKASGAAMIADRRAEPEPIPGKPGSLPVILKAAVEGDLLRLRLSFSEGQQPDAAMDKAFATKVSVMIGAAAPDFARGGCFAACHDDAARMASAPPEGARTKYLAASRVAMTRQGGGDALRPAEDLARARAEGRILEYWQARLNPGAPAVPAQGIVYEARIEDAKPEVAAEATMSNGAWTLDLSRRLETGPPHLALRPDRLYTIGIAIHAGHTARRFHYVSLEQTLSLGPSTDARADIVAARR